LERFLEVLHATPEQRYEAFILLGVPRALTALKQLAEDQPDFGAWIPAVGDLWWALRLRRGLTARQVVQHLGVSASTVSRWEASLETVPQERCDQLLDLLGAYPGERFVLRDERVILMPHAAPAGAPPIRRRVSGLPHVSAGSP
jgi:hypothetical protein